MIADVLRNAGLRSVHLQIAALASIVGCIGLWQRAKSMEEGERNNAERRAIFLGLWPPTLWIISESLRRVEAE